MNVQQYLRMSKAVWVWRLLQGLRKTGDADVMRITSRRSLKLKEANVDSGMVLPFEPMIMTFKNMHYYVPLPPVRLPF